MSRRLRHSACRRGKRVLVLLKDGTRILDRFVDRESRYVVLAKHGRIPKKQIQSFNIYKGP